MSLFATKSIEQIRTEQLGSGAQSLKRVLGPVDLLLLGVGAVIGTGIFVLTGQAAAAYAGPAIVISMVIAGLASWRTRRARSWGGSAEAGTMATPNPERTKLKSVPY